MKSEQLTQLKAQILHNGVCPQLAMQATQLVFGSGDPDAQIVFIGEAPGKQEDIKGIPFVGASGKFLQELLATIGLTRDEVYITNIVKYRPPNNRDPSRQEKEAFLPYLQQQLDIIDPKVIATLGRHSLNGLIPNQVIGQVHGTKLTDTKGRAVFPLYHPAAALYDGSLRQTLKDDFQKLKNLIS